jgi:hypothetical protein
MQRDLRLQLPSTSPTLGERAASDLRFIRSAMAGAGRFTAVPGRGGVFMGLVALGSALVAARTASQADWLLVWILGACLAFVGGAWSLGVKARQQNLPLTSGVGRRFLLGLCPSLVAGVVLTWILWRCDATLWLPVAWLLLYGSAILSAGALSVPVVPVTGGAFMALGLLAAGSPTAWGPGLLVVGFGGLHIISGIWITLRHGG